jgi:hypothetical protein
MTTKMTGLELLFAGSILKLLGFGSLECIPQSSKYKRMPIKWSTGEQTERGEVV